MNFESGTGGVRFCNGAGGDAAAIDSNKGRATVGNGLPAEYAAVDRVNQSVSIGTTTLYAVPFGGAGVYWVGYYVKVTTVATTTGSVILTIGWTDEDDGGVLAYACVHPLVTPPPPNPTSPYDPQKKLDGCRKVYKAAT